MGDKVYGFCGTNKCKREVMAMSYLLQYVDGLTLDANFAGKYSGTLKFDLPDGWDRTNTVVVGAMLIPDWQEGQRYHTWQPIGAQNQIEEVTISVINNDSGSQLSVQFTDSAQLSPRVRVLIMNVDELPVTNKGTITGGGTNPPLGG